MKKIILTLRTIKPRLLAMLLAAMGLASLSEAAVNSKEQNFSQALSAGALDATTSFATTDAGFLSVVTVRFSTAPASAETIKVYRDSRAGANFDSLLASYTTTAGSTTDVVFVVGNAVPIAETDQVRVTCTNVSAGPPTAYVSVVLDPAPRMGSSQMQIWDNGALKVSSSLKGHTIKDEGIALTHRPALNFTGPGITCSDDAGNAETDCDVPAATGAVAGVVSTTAQTLAGDKTLAGTLTVENTGTANSFVVNDTTGDTTPFVVDASGKVGIGTATPSAPVTVRLDTTIGYADIFINASTPIDGQNDTFGFRYFNNGQIRFGFPTDDGFAHINFLGSGHQARMVGTWGFPSGAAYPNPHLGADSTSGDDVRLSITKSGNGASQSLYASAMRYAVSGSSPDFNLYANGIAFGLRDGSFWNEAFDKIAMQIAPSTGNIGIGTTSPTHLLSLSGQAAQTIWMERNTTADTAGQALTIAAGGATSGATNKNGGDLTLKSGIATGTGSSKVYIQTPAPGASGTADATDVNRLVLNGNVNLTSGAAATVATVTLPAGAGHGGQLMYSVFASDGIDLIEASGQVAYAIVNKAGVYASTVNVVGTEAQAKSDGTDTITTAWAFDASTNLQVTSTIAGMTPTTHRVTYTVLANAAQTVTVP